MENRRAAIETDVEERLNLLGSGRAQVISTWLDGLTRLPAEIVKSELVALFASETSSRDAGSELPFYLLQQKSYVETVLTEFVEKNGLKQAHLLDAKGDALLNSTGAGSLSDAQRDAARTLIKPDASSALLLRHDADHVLDLILPIAAPGGGKTPVGTLLVQASVAGDLKAFLAPSPWFGRTERYSLVTAGDPAKAVSRDSSGALVTGPAGVLVAKPESFSAVAGTSVNGQAYAVATAIGKSPWTLLVEIPAATALAPLETDRRAVIAMTLALMVFLILVMIALWLNQTRQFNEAMAEQHEASALRIDAQRQLLSRINETITDGIALKGRDGRYTVANPAFARLTGHDADDIVGKTSDDLFDADLAGRLRRREKDRAAGEMDRGPLHEKLGSGSKEALVDIEAVPLASRDGGTGGFLTVIHDRTEERLSAMRREQAAAQTIVAYMKAVELSDPYLHGQSAFVRKLGVDLARRATLSVEEAETIDICSSLFQIGKLFVPKDILRKSSPLSDEETATLRRHVDHLERMLDGLDFGYPVRETVCQMYERLDGSGYPKGASGDAISRAARVLGLTDSFCALVRPRAYRPANTPERALDILKREPAKYDPALLEALETAIGEGAPQKIMERLFPEETQTS